MVCSTRKKRGRKPFTNFTNTLLAIIFIVDTCFISISFFFFQGKTNWEKLFEAPNFFAKYRHFLVLEASSATEEDQLEWYGYVESKVRHLILNLEREAIELAHVWPKTYPSLEEGREKLCCYWFIGLLIKPMPKPSDDSGNQPRQNLDLTTPIKNFQELVMRQAASINVSILHVMKLNSEFYVPFS